MIRKILVTGLAMDKRHDFMPLPQEALHKMGACEASCSGDEDTHTKDLVPTALSRDEGATHHCHYSALFQVGVKAVQVNGR